MNLFAAHTEIILGMILVGYLYYICMISRKKLIKEQKQPEINFNGMPETSIRILKSRIENVSNAHIISSNGKYEYCTYIENGHSFIFYPHKSTNGIYSVRVRVSNPNIVSEEKTKILKELVSLGFHCKSLPKNWR